MERVRSLTDICDLIGSYFPIRPTAVICPFHQEILPTFTVSSDSQTFNCHGCGRHGNVFEFVMLYEGVEFEEAVKRLADRLEIR